MRTHDGMLGWRILLLLFLELLLVHESAEGAGEIVDGAHAFEGCTDVLVESIVRGIHVAEERIATNRWNLTRQQDRAERWLQAPGHVAVPYILIAAHVGVLLQHNHFGMAVAMRNERMHFELPKAAREGNMLLRG